MSFLKYKFFNEKQIKSRIKDWRGYEDGDKGASVWLYKSKTEMFYTLTVCQYPVCEMVLWFCKMLFLRTKVKDTWDFSALFF